MFCATKSNDLECGILASISFVMWGTIFWNVEKENKISNNLKWKVFLLNFIFPILWQRTSWKGTHGSTPHWQKSGRKRGIPSWLPCVKGVAPWGPPTLTGLGQKKGIPLWLPWVSRGMEPNKGLHFHKEWGKKKRY